VLDDYLARFRTSAFRLETRDRYTVDDEADLFASFLRGEPLPDWTPDNSPWHRLVSDHAASGRTMQRVHLIAPPLSDYLRFEFAAQLGCVKAGEDCRVVDLTQHPHLQQLDQDFWIFDDVTVLLMDYDDEGRPTGAHTARSVKLYRVIRDSALDASVPLNHFHGLSWNVNSSALACAD